MLQPTIYKTMLPEVTELLHGGFRSGELSFISNNQTSEIPEIMSTLEGTWNAVNSETLAAAKQTILKSISEKIPVDGFLIHAGEFSASDRDNLKELNSIAASSNTVIILFYPDIGHNRMCLPGHRNAGVILHIITTPHRLSYEVIRSKHTDPGIHAYPLDEELSKLSENPSV